MTRKDPYRSFRFLVEIDGINRAGFQSVNGLERITEIESFKEGGENHYEHQLAGRTSYPPLVLKRGLIDDDLWKWHRDVIAGTIQRRKISIYLLGEDGAEVWRWVCEGAFPSKWTGGELNAENDGVGTESIEFVHQGMTE